MGLLYQNILPRFNPRQFPNSGKQVSIQIMDAFSALRNRELPPAASREVRKIADRMVKACREAIALKIEPPIWYYNLACALAVQGKRDMVDIISLAQGVAEKIGDADMAGQR